jgi:hypothetical protein
MPYQQGPYGQPQYGQPGQYGPPPGSYPYPGPQKKSRKGLIIGLVILAVVLLGGLAAAVVVFVVATKDKVIATNLATGDCITDIPDGTLVKIVPKTECSEPHAGEVYAVLTMPDGQYPGQSTIDEWQNKCPDELESYSADAATDDSIGVFVLYPTSETWAQGDREIVCLATTEDKRSGSIKG